MMLLLLFWLIPCFGEVSVDIHKAEIIVYVILVMLHLFCCSNLLMYALYMSCLSTVPLMLVNSCH